MWLETEWSEGRYRKAGRPVTGRERVTGVRVLIVAMIPGTT